MTPSWAIAPTTPNIAATVAAELWFFAERRRSTVAREIMADLVTEHRGELGFVVDAKHEAAPDLHHAVGRHGGIEVRRAHEVHTDVRAMRAAEPAGHVLHA